MSAHVCVFFMERLYSGNRYFFFFINLGRSWQICVTSCDFRMHSPESLNFCTNPAFLGLIIPQQSSLLHFSGLQSVFFCARALRLRSITHILLIICISQRQQLKTGGLFTFSAISALHLPTS